MIVDKFDLKNYLIRQKAFSLETFGPGHRTEGLIDHITKELEEVRTAPLDLKEWVDIITLALDGAWRAGHLPDDIVNQLEATLTRNTKRDWPDWRTAEPDKAIEHKR
jgi:hypothetical protein